MSAIRRYISNVMERQMAQNSHVLFFLVCFVFSPVGLISTTGHGCQVCVFMSAYVWVCSLMDKAWIFRDSGYWFKAYYDNVRDKSTLQ